MTRYRVELTGQRFGRLVVVSRAESVNGKNRWNVKCDCGTEKISSGADLVKGKTLGCGCVQRIRAGESLRARQTRHGMSGTPTHLSWSSMIARCTCASTVNYDNYGGRGIAVCARWMVFENFLSDMGERPPGCSLDRFPDNDGNYEPGNCRWATRTEQTRNRSITKRIEFRGQVKCVAEWASEIGIPAGTLYHRFFRAGWTAERSLTTPLFAHPVRRTPAATGENRHE